MEFFGMMNSFMAFFGKCENALCLIKYKWGGWGEWLQAEFLHIKSDLYVIYVNMPQSIRNQACHCVFVIQHI